MSNVSFLLTLFRFQWMSLAFAGLAAGAIACGDDDPADPSDAGNDAAVDAGLDAGFDAGFDAGPLSDDCDVSFSGTLTDGPRRIRAGDDNSTFAQLAAGNDRWVVFLSRAADLVTGDTNGRPDVFLWDRAKDTLARVNVSGSGTETNGSSDKPSISSDGCYVVFNSRATNLVSPDENADVNDVFLLDRKTGTLDHISRSTGGDWSDGESTYGSASDDGRYVVFHSNATNLVSGDSNGKRDVFLRDRMLGTTERLSVGPSGEDIDGDSAFPRITPDGRFVVFVSNAVGAVAGKTTTNYEVFLWEQDTTGLTQISVPLAGRTPTNSFSSDSFGVPVITPDGRFVAFTSWSGDLVEGDTNGVRDVFVRDRLFNGTARVSISSDEEQANDHANVETNGISSDGRYVVFASETSNLVDGDSNDALDVFVRDITAGTTRRLGTDTGGEADGTSERPSISSSGNLIVYESAATNLVSGASATSTYIYIDKNP